MQHDTTDEYATVIPNTNPDVVAIIVDRDKLDDSGGVIVFARDWIVSFTIRTTPPESAYRDFMSSLDCVVSLDESWSSDDDQLVVFDERRDRWSIPADMAAGNGMASLAKHIATSAKFSRVRAKA